MVILGPVAARLTDNDEDPRPAAELRRLIREADAVHAWVNDNLGVARKVLPDLRTDSDISIVFGRRTPTSYNSHWLAELNDSLLSVRIRTYDWLIEAAANLVIPEL